VKVAKKPKEIVPFFKLRFQINDTLEALSHEILMSLQAMEAAVDLGGMNEPGKKILRERIEGIKKICLSDIGENQ
jgi:hypothetical protein